MIITDDFGVEFDVDCLEVDEEGYTIIKDSYNAADHSNDTEIDEYIFIRNDGTCMVFSKEEIDHIMSIDSDDDPDDVLARDVGVRNSRCKLNDFKR